MNRQTQGPDDGPLIIFVIIMMAVIFGIPYVYDAIREPFNYAVLWANYISLYPFDALGFKQAGRAVHWIDTHYPESFGFTEVKALFAITGYYWRWPISALFLYLATKTLSRSVTDQFVRGFTMESLVRDNARSFPCMYPVAYRNLLQAPFDAGNWATVRQPVQFVAEHELLLNTHGEPLPKDWLLNKSGTANIRSPLFELDEKHPERQGISLDRKKATGLFVAQLGRPFESIDDLPDYQRALAAAFMAFGHGDKKTANTLLDQFSKSFVEGGVFVKPRATLWRRVKMGKDAEREIIRECITESHSRLSGKEARYCEIVEQEFFIDTSGVDKVLDEYRDSEDMAWFTRNHNGYAHTYILSLLRFARQKGVLASSSFIWLRPTDRMLWYILNGDKPYFPERNPAIEAGWVEAAGVIAHMLAEDVLKQTITEPMVDEAVKSLSEYLYEQGWLAEAE